LIMVWSTMNFGLADTTTAAMPPASGAHTYTSREEIAATLAPVADDVLARRARLLLTGTSPGSLTAQRGGVHDALDTLASAVGAVRCGAAVDDGTFVEIGLALWRQDVRDACLAFSLGAEASAAETLWAALTRGLPGKWRAAPAALLAVAAYLRGDGALANIALDISEDAAPGYVLATLLRYAFQGGVSPTQLHGIIKEMISSP
jgi:Domain of unknown function (DUF4192)